MAYKCPWCSTKSGMKSSIRSHMVSCYRRPSKYRTVSSAVTEDDDDGFLLTAVLIDSLMESTSDYGSSGSDYGSSSSSWGDSSSSSSDSGSSWSDSSSSSSDSGGGSFGD